MGKIVPMEPTTMTTAPRKCQNCNHVALLGTPGEADALDPRNCAVCDHDECGIHSGFTFPFRGPAPALYVAPAEAPAQPSPLPPRDPRFDLAPALPLPLLLATATALTLARFGALAKLTTCDALTWQVVCVDPDNGALLGDHPSGAGTTAEGAAGSLLDALHELNVADAEAADARADADLEHHLALGERGPSLADAYPPFTVSMEEARALAAEGEAADALADDLVEDVGLLSAAAIVRRGLRDLAPAILSDLARLDTSAPAGSVGGNRAAAARTLGPIVEAWGRGDDGAVLAARAAWVENGCGRCAVAALAAPAARCSHCAEVA